MKALPFDASDEQIKQWIREWVGLLARQRYEEAAQVLLPETPSGSGLPNDFQLSQWTPELLQAVIQNYGIPYSQEEPQQVYRVIPVENSFREIFESRLEVVRYVSPPTPDRLGMVHVDLPLNDGDDVSDLTAIFDLRRVDQDRLGFELLGIHVL